ncbi:MAG: hypothetical protein NT151_09945 [Acidobacteria bacterium]|nr:hypothetical protein [Acidobacteriota bacterium]
MSLRVRVLHRGCYGNSLRRESDIFTLAREEHFSARWMVRVSEDIPEHRASAQQSLNAELGKMSPLGSARRVLIPVDPGEDAGVIHDFNPFETSESCHG